MKTLHVAARPEHVCRPGYKRSVVTKEEAAGSTNPFAFAGTFIVTDPFEEALPAGSVVECDCGKTWVKLPDQAVDNGRSFIHLSNQWRPEKKRERRKRERIV